MGTFPLCVANVADAAGSSTGRTVVGEFVPAVIEVPRARFPIVTTTAPEYVAYNGEVWEKFQGPVMVHGCTVWRKVPGS